MHFHEFFANKTSPVDFFSLQFFYLGINWIIPFLLQAVAAVAFIVLLSHLEHSIFIKMASFSRLLIIGSNFSKKLPHLTIL